MGEQTEVTTIDWETGELPDGLWARHISEAIHGRNCQCGDDDQIDVAVATLNALADAMKREALATGYRFSSDRPVYIETSRACCADCGGPSWLVVVKSWVLVAAE